jgi:hypothetical protein
VVALSSRVNLSTIIGSFAFSVLAVSARDFISFESSFAALGGKFCAAATVAGSDCFSAQATNIANKKPATAKHRNILFMMAAPQKNYE